MKLNSEKREAFDPQYLVQFFHQFPNIVPKYRLSNASKLSRQTCHKKKRQSMIPPQRNSNRSSARYVDYRENLIFFLSLSLATIPSSTRINPSFFGGGNGRSESIRPWRVTGSGGRRVTRLVMPAGKGALSASLKAIPRVVRNNTACELVRAWRRNGTEPVAASTSTTPREIGFFFRVVRLPEQLRSMRFSCLSPIWILHPHDTQTRYATGQPCPSSRVHPRGTRRTIDELWDGVHARGYVSGLRFNEL